VHYQNDKEFSNNILGKRTPEGSQMP